MGEPSLAALIIMDGLALNCEEKGNAVKAANTPNLDRLMAEHPWSKLGASGRDVGLMEGQMGDSNVGHLNLGAGRIVTQYVLTILDAIDDGSFAENEALITNLKEAAKEGQSVHIIGLISTGGVHSHSRIAHATAKIAAEHGIAHTYVHALTDGRDTPPKSGLGFINDFDRSISSLPGVEIASVSGRYFAMDRDQRWERTNLAYDTIVLGQGPSGTSAGNIVKDAYDRGETDEFLTPTVVVGDDGQPLGRIRPGDLVIFANFRADRARQLTDALIKDDFDGFKRAEGMIPVGFLSMTQYDASYDVPVAFPPRNMKQLLGEVVSHAGLNQMRIAETEKYAHVTYFFNGGREDPFPGEDRRLIASPKVATYDLQPEMSAEGVTEAALEAIKSKKYKLIVINFANCDMVGHTGNFEAAVRAVETVDACVGRLAHEILKAGGKGLITADHGNADEMIDEKTNGPHTFHTLHPVPCILIGEKEDIGMKDGVLADIAPTLLDLLGLDKPREMTGTRLTIKNV